MPSLVRTQESRMSAVDLVLLFVFFLNLLVFACQAYPLRPELVESTLLMHRATGDHSWLWAGRDFLGSLQVAGLTRDRGQRRVRWDNKCFLCSPNIN